jgi:hypothetical protein
MKRRQSRSGTSGSFVLLRMIHTRATTSQTSAIGNRITQAG